MGRTEGRVRLVKIAIALAVLLPPGAGISFAIGGEPAALVATAFVAGLGGAVAAIPLVLPARRFRTWVLLSTVALFVGGAFLLWIGGLLLWPAAGVMAAAVPWRWAWRLVALGLAAVIGCLGLIWGGSEAYKCINPANTMLVRFEDPPLEERRDQILKSEGVEGISWMDPGTEIEVEFDGDARAARDRLAGQLRRDPAVLSVNARPGPCD